VVHGDSVAKLLNKIVEKIDYNEPNFTPMLTKNATGVFSSELGN
jgi:hypothetical protein